MNISYSILQWFVLCFYVKTIIHFLSIPWSLQNPVVHNGSASQLHYYCCTCFYSSIHSTSMQTYSCFRFHVYSDVKSALFYCVLAYRSNRKESCSQALVEMKVGMDLIQKWTTGCGWQSSLPWRKLMPHMMAMTVKVNMRIELDLEDAECIGSGMVWRVQLNYNSHVYFKIIYSITSILIWILPQITIKSFFIYVFFDVREDDVPDCSFCCLLVTFILQKLPLFSVLSPYKINIYICMAQINGHPLYSLLTHLASLPGPSFDLFSSQFSDIGLSLPSPNGRDFTQKINGSNCRSVGNDANANLRALGYIMYSFMFENGNIDEELMEMYFKDVLLDEERLSQIQNCPYFEELTGEHRRKVVATMLLDLVQVSEEGRMKDMCGKLKIISEIFGVCARASLIKEGKEHQESNYGMRLFSDYIYPKIIQKLDLEYHHKPLIYFFPQKQLFIAFPDQRQYICGTYLNHSIQQAQNSPRKKQLNSPNPQTIPFENFKLNIGEQFDFQPNHIGGTPYFNDDVPTPKFQFKPAQIQKMKINPIIEEEPEDFGEGTVGNIKNSQISRFMEKSSISDFHPHECESNGEDSESEEKDVEVETVKIRPEYRMRTGKEIKKSTPIFCQKEQTTERKEKSKNVVKVEKGGKTSYSGSVDGQNLEPKKVIYSCTDQKTRVKIPAFLENKKKKDHQISLISNIYHYTLNKSPENQEKEGKTLVKRNSIENLVKGRKLSKSRRRNSNIPEFLLNRRKKNSEEDLQKFKSQKLLKPKIHFTYRSPVKNDPSMKHTHRHTKSTTTKQMLIFPY